MSEVTLSMNMPLDGDGFLRRECPACERQFKWWPGVPEASTTAAAEGAATEAYFCPYCYEPAALTTWWTQEQIAYAQQLASAEIVGPQLRDLQETIDTVNRRGGLIHIETNLVVPNRPEPLVEPDDMVRIDLPCHLEEPLKVDEMWDSEVACLVCGIRYPIEFVRALPETPEEAL